MAADLEWVDDVPVASVRIFEDRVAVTWGDHSEQMPAKSEHAALNAGLSWVAVRAAEISGPITVRVVWLVSWLVVVEPGGRYHRLDGHPTRLSPLMDQEQTQLIGRKRAF